VGIEQTFAGGRVIADATWFANSYDDLIVAVGPAFADASRYRTDNISNARARGLELSGALRLPAGLAVRAGYTHLRTEILAVDGGSAAPPPFTVGQPLLRRPRHQGFVDATFVRDRADGFFRVSTRGEVLDVDPSYGAFGGTLVAPGFVTADLGASWRPLARARHAVFARVTNLLDRDYEEAFGFPSPGRAVIVGLRLAHGR
jgi:outer membrane receptor protein involved in Fe transport